jgi:hypothetical protein
MPFEYLLNADFDLSLRPRFRGGRGVAAQVMALRPHVLLAGGPEDSVLLPEALPEPFLAYLDGKGVPVPRVTVEPATRREATLAPFGWNRAAAELNRCYDRPAPHPPLEVVRRVNGRRFSVELQRELGVAGDVVGVFGALEALERALAREAPAVHGFVVKADHGNAGLGNRRLRGSSLSEVDRRFVSGLLAEDDAVVLERWSPRRLDLSTTFTVTAGGEAEGVQVHEVVTTTDGGFVGAVFEAGGEMVAPWRDDLGLCAAAVARRLAAEGYFGPVCVDAFVGSDGRLRPLVDLNARAHVSAPALRLFRGLGGQVTVYWRFFSARKLDLPRDEVELDHVLGVDAFAPDPPRGALLTVPLRRCDERPQPRLGVVFVAPRREDVLAMEGRFRKRFES